MRLVSMTPSSVHVVLSKRNLLALLHKVDQPWSEKTLVKYEGEVGAMVTLVVTAELDDEHYHHADRRETERGRAGMLHPETAEFVAVKSDKQCGSTDPRGTCFLPFGHAGDCVMTHMEGN